MLGADYYEDFTGQQRAWDPDGDRVCARTNHEGYAVFEVINSLGTLTDITADFVEEGLFRSAKVFFNQPGQAPIANPTPTVVGASGNTPDGPGLIVDAAPAPCTGRRRRYAGDRRHPNGDGASDASSSADRQEHPLEGEGLDGTAYLPAVGYVHPAAAVG